MTARKRLIAALVWAVAMAAAIAYMTCGNDSSRAPQAVKRCQLVVGAKVITVDSRETNAAAAVEYCKRVGAAEIYVGSDARRTDVLQIQGALTNAHIDVLSHGLK